MFAEIIVVIALLIIIWLSYYISASVYKNLKANHNKYARLIQVLIALGIFAILTVLLGVLIISQMRFTRE